MTRRCFALLASTLLTSAAFAAPPADLDARVDAAMRAHGVPGMSIAIVEGGKPTLTKGYGVRRLGSPERVDADTIFPTGSTGKAITAAALAVLVDDGKIKWDDKVIDHMPWFRMYDPWVTNEITVRDLLVHRSGLGLGAGDLMFIPTSSRSRADTVRALRYIKPATSFRSGYAYDNVLYSVAGQLIEEVTGQTWEVFVRERVLKPAGMTSSVTEQSARFANPNRAWPHARTNGRVRGMGEQAVLDERKTLGDNGAPAGGLSSSANDLAHWMQVQLGHGAWTNEAGKEVRVFSEQSAQQMWTPVVPTPTPKYPGKLAGAAPKFSSYALGWSVRDYRGEKVIEHGGAIFGVYTYIALFPDRDFGVAFQMNSEDVQVMRGVALEVIDHYLGAPKTDWVAAFDEFLDMRTDGGLAALDAAAKATPAAQGKPTLAQASYAGRYADPWYGPITITNDKGALRVNFLQTPGLTGRLEHVRYDTFRTVWDNPEYEQAYVNFGLNAEGKVERITMKAISPIADFSWDFQDLLFTPSPKS
ncbi:CubicO group peptidase (beta-lactamase class C family) [Lysobacter niastensis]|uniref:CubicO group peptidase (Beta-lactamase class C family) n=1 Tax=Lysobacter niastensis TaxID=380629 RepID=A0ABU1WC46_9GAMM|nr:serine hydrolase [Lysobacter niastensis]MDR7134970.1 CubicO group peptidase (beta-lactamase class C family) [Lysobacter niastensis]